MFTGPTVFAQIMAAVPAWEFRRLAARHRLLGPKLRFSAWEVFKTTIQVVFLWGLPYLWISFLVIEKTRLRFGGPRGEGAALC